MTGDPYSLLADQDLTVGAVSGGRRQIQYQMPQTITLYRGGVHVTYKAERVAVFDTAGGSITEEKPVDQKP